MNRTLQASLAVLTIAVAPRAVWAQSGAIPLQAGVSVQLPVTSNAVEVPNADRPDALVVAVTAGGIIYLGVEPVAPAALGDRVKRAVSARSDKTLYLKTDARVPSARLIEVIDAIRSSGVATVTILTAQPERTDRRPTVVAPKGLELRLVGP